MTVKKISFTGRTRMWRFVSQAVVIRNRNDGLKNGNLIFLLYLLFFLVSTKTNKHDWICKCFILNFNTLNSLQFHDKTPYTIMFGPDKCGNDYKLHFIFRHVNPVNGTIEEKHAKKPKERIEESFNDKKPHLYQLVVRPDNTYTISIDQKIVNEGSLLTDFTPPVNPPKEIDDPKDFKPETWDEREKVGKKD